MALENYLYEHVKTALRSVPPAQARDVYAFYLVLSLDEAGGYRPSIASLAWLTNADVTDEKAKNFGSRWSGWAASGEAIITLCDEERDPQGFALQTAFYESLLSDDAARCRWAAFTFAWPFRWNEEGMTEREQAHFATMLDALDIGPEDRRFISSTTNALVPIDLSQTFFPVLADVIKRLHTDGVMVEVCGSAVPVGVMATNDVGYRYGLEPTRLGNPGTIARGMEEWMMGETYSAIDARTELEREIGQRTRQEQAHYWAQAAVEVSEYFGNGKRSTLIEDLEKRGLVLRETDRHINDLHIHQRLQDLLPYAASHMVTLIEARAGNTHNTDWRNKTPADHAESLLSTLEGISSDGERGKVPEETIDSLVKLMHRLWPSYKDMRARKERTGFCLQYVARVLHALRPERFPRWRQNPRDSGDFNFADYGLT